MEEKPSLIDLKVAELLKEVRLHQSLSIPQAALDTLRSCLQAIPEQQVDASLSPSFIQDLGVPPHKTKFTFKCPDSVNIVGSFASHTIARPRLTIDLAILMPKICFHEKDYLNHRYHAKRALYLAVLRKHLCECSVVQSTKWSLLHHDARKPVLIVHLVNEVESSSTFDICLLPIIAPEIFDTSKLAPSRNNVKADSSGMGIEATPHYSSSILEDMKIEMHSSFLKTSFSQLDGLEDTVLLLKVWMRQRGFPGSADSLNGFLISMLLVHLTINVGDQKITGNMKAFQIFRICIEALASGNVLEKGLSLQKNNFKLAAGVKQTYCQLFDVVMIDPTGAYNMAFRVTKSALKEIKEEARHTIAAIKSSRDCGFDEVFMTAVDFPSKFDYHIRISVKDNSSGCTFKPPFFQDEDKCRDFERQVENILSKGLGNRAGLIRTYPRSLPSSWSIEEGVHVSGKLPVFVGINASNFETAYRMTDVGPSADDKEEAAKFRSFWGEKAELRRFKDGTIAETAVWECEPSQRHLILQKIVEHLLSRHLSLWCCDIHVVAGQLDFAISEGKKDISASAPKLLEVFEIFSKRLRNLEDLPLKISSIQPLSAAFRHTSVFAPQVHVLADERVRQVYGHKWVDSFCDPLEVMIQLEGSGRWPSNPKAVEKIKVAFCLKIAESMHRLYGTKCVAAEDSVDLLMHGFCFRLKIYYDKDPTLVQKRLVELNRITKESILQPVKNMDLPVSPKHDLLLQSLHSSMLNGIQGCYPVYGPTVRLAKRWVASHLFSDVVRDEAIELIVAYLFLKPVPYAVPLSQITGFMRFLKLLMNFDWALSPLIVDLSGDLTPKELNFIMDEFHGVRKSQQSNQLESKGLQGGPAMYIATPYDMKSLTWTRHSPSLSTLKRLVAYARTSVDLLCTLIRGQVSGRWETLFHTPLNLYHILLKIDRNKLHHPFRVLFPADIKADARVVIKSLSQYDQAWPPSVSHGELPDAEKQLLIGFDPTLCLLQDLKTRFGDLFFYWYDSIGSDVIALTWTRIPSRICVKKRKRVEEDFVGSDQESLLVEMGEMGEGFLESIHVLPSP